MSEQVLLMDVKRFAVHDGPGIRTTLFLKGCPLHCIWCHNPEGIAPQSEMAYYAQKCIGCGECVSVCPNKAHKADAEGHVFDRSLCKACGVCEDVCLGEAMKRFGRPVDADEAMDIVLEDRIFYASSNGGVTVSGGEPLLHPGFVRELFERLKAEHIHTAVDTCGCVSREALEQVMPVTDIFLYDIKHIDEEAHRRLTGQGNRRILENLEFLSKAGKQIEIRMPFVPGCNTEDETVKGIGQFLGRLNISSMKVLPYHSLARSKYRALGKADTMPDVEAPEDAAIAHAVEILRDCGVPAFSGKE